MPADSPLAAKHEALQAIERDLSEKRLALRDAPHGLQWNDLQHQQWVALAGVVEGLKARSFALRAELGLPAIDVSPLREGLEAIEAGIPPTSPLPYLENL